MKNLTKIFAKILVSFCLILCFASTAYCINPFEVNNGGFGPKIKGLQLGMRLDAPSLAHIVEFALNLDFLRFPFQLWLNNGNAWGVNDKDFLAIEISSTSDNKLVFKVADTKGRFKIYRGINGRRDEFLRLLSDIEQEKFIDVSIGNGVLLSHFTVNWASRRIIGFSLERSSFNANALTEDEFVQDFINAYHIPKIQPELMELYGGTFKTVWRYRDISEGWGVQCEPESSFEAVVVFPIITRPTFNQEASNKNTKRLESLLGDSDEQNNDGGEAIFEEFIESIEMERKWRMTTQHTDEDIDKFDYPVEDPEDLPDNPETLYQRAWRGKDYIFIVDGNKSWSSEGQLVTCWVADPEITFAYGLRTGSSIDELRNIFADARFVHLVAQDDKAESLSLSFQNRSLTFYLKNNKISAIQYDYWIIGEGQPLTRKMKNLFKSYEKRK